MIIKRFVFVILLMFFSVLMFAENRIALLIANGNYRHFSSLSNPIPEAEDLAKNLRILGFDVILKKDLSKEQMSDALFEFQCKLVKSGGIGFFHYGGHAVQVNGENYLIPADADIPDERRIDNRCVSVDEVLDSMSGETNIIVLDACRDNPLSSGSGRSATRGLVPINRKPRNSVIVYSAQAGSTAIDGVFTPIFSKMILQNKSLSQIVREVRVAVKEMTDNKQSPGTYDDCDYDIYLAGAYDNHTQYNLYQTSLPFEKKKNDIRKTSHASKHRRWYDGDYRYHTYLYGSLIGLGAFCIPFGLVFTIVGAVNMGQCAHYHFNQGVLDSLPFLLVGLFSSSFTLVSFPVVLYIWNKDKKEHGLAELKNKKNMTRNQRLLVTAYSTSIDIMYDIKNEQLNFLVGIKL